MHKPFSVSGFLYHSPSQQILLQQLTTDNDPTLALFRGSSEKNADPQTVFQQCVEQALGILIPAASIHPIYDYVHDELGEQFIFYADVADATPTAYSSKNKTAWYVFSKLAKYNMSEQTRHDIIVGERVLRSLFESTQPPRVINNRH